MPNRCSYKFFLENLLNATRNLKSIKYFGRTDSVTVDVTRVRMRFLFTDVPQVCSTHRGVWRDHRIVNMLGE